MPPLREVGGPHAGRPRGARGGRAALLWRSISGPSSAATCGSSRDSPASGLPGAQPSWGRSRRVRLGRGRSSAQAAGHRLLRPAEEPALAAEERPAGRLHPDQRARCPRERRRPGATPRGSPSSPGGGWPRARRGRSGSVSPAMRSGGRGHVGQGSTPGVVGNGDVGDGGTRSARSTPRLGDDSIPRLGRAPTRRGPRPDRPGLRDGHHHRPGGAPPPPRLGEPLTRR